MRHLIRSILCLAALGLLVPSAAVAQGLVADAWGYAEPSDGVRAGWAGFRGAEGATPPGPPHDILLFVGQKSLVAGQDIGMAAALVLDEVGNLAADGTEVTLTLDQRIQVATSRNGVADAIIAATRAGHYHAGASAANVQSNRAEYDVTPDLLSVVLSVAPDSGLARVEAFHDFATNPLRDRFGNAVVGGTLASFVLMSDDGSLTFLPGQVTNGAGSARMLARDMGDSTALAGQFKAIVGIAASAPAPYRIIPISPIEPLRIKVAQNPDLGLESMTIGPFLTDAGHYLNDGAPVQAQARLSNGQALSVDAWVQDGKVVIDWLLPAGVTMSSVLISSPMGQTKHDLATVPKGRP